MREREHAPVADTDEDMQPDDDNDDEGQDAGPSGHAAQDQVLNTPQESGQAATSVQGGHESDLTDYEDVIEGKARFSLIVSDCSSQLLFRGTGSSTPPHTCFYLTSH